VTAEHPLQDLHGEEARIAIGDTAQVLDLDRVHRGALRERARDPAEVVRQRQERA
jgi:hypothetical protein